MDLPESSVLAWPTSSSYSVHVSGLEPERLAFWKRAAYRALFLNAVYLRPRRPSRPRKTISKVSGYYFADSFQKLNGRPVSVSHRRWATRRKPRVQLVVGVKP